MLENKMFAYIQKNENRDDERSIVCYASTGSTDRHGEMILPSAWTEKGLKNYRKNPVILLNHSYNSLPVGKSLWQKPDEKGLKFKIQFASTDLGNELYYLYSNGFMNSFSVGFRPIKEYDNEDEVKYKDKDGSVPHTVYEEVELLELSAVSIPACPDANIIRNVKSLVDCEQKGLIKSKEIQELVVKIKESPEYIELITVQDEDKAKVVGFIDLEKKECENNCENCNCEKEEAEKLEEDDIKSLLGSSKLPSDINLFDGAVISLGGLVAKAFEKSCLSVDEWNSLGEEEREDLFEKQIAELKNEKKEGNDEILEFSLDEIIEKELEIVQKESQQEEKQVEIKNEQTEVERIQKLLNSLNVKNLDEKQKTEIVKKQYGEDFDITQVKTEPYGFEYKIFTKFLKCKVKDIFTTAFFVPHAMTGNYFSAFKNVLSPHSLLDERNFTYNGFEVPLNYEIIQLDSKKAEEFLISGTRFYKSKDAENFVIQYIPSWGGNEIVFFSHKNQSDFLKGIISDSVKWAKENNLLKGEKFSVGGEFLEKTGIEWEDVIFPSDETKNVIKRNVEHLSKEKNSRGMIFFGKPGNGKTRCGRVLMEKSDTTFIWASSKDFKYSANYTLGLGFEMARELAPSIFFIEDIDTWLNGYTVDLLKTEMDGIRNNKGVLTILTSNFPEELPDALIDRPGRFHHIVEFSMPNEDNRKKMLKKWIKNADKYNIDEFVQKTENFSGAYLKELVDLAQMISEDESIEIDVALMKALEQIQGQKELINEIKKPKAKSVEIDVEMEEAPVLEICEKEIELDIEDFKSTVKGMLSEVIKFAPSAKDIFDERLMKAKGIIF